MRSGASAVVAYTAVCSGERAAGHPAVPTAVRGLTAQRAAFDRPLSVSTMPREMPGIRVT